MNVNAMIAVVARNYPGSEELDRWADALLSSDTDAARFKGIGDNLARAIATETIETFTEDLGPNRNLIALKQTLRRWRVDLQLVIDTLDAQLDENILDKLERDPDSAEQAG